MGLRRLVGVLAAAVVLFFWGFVYWFVNPLPYQTWQATADDATAQRQLREVFPEDGVYAVPGIDNSMAELTDLYAEGPQVLAFVVQQPGAPMDPGALVAGFFQQLATAAILVSLLPFAHGFGGRLALAALGGLASVVIIDLTDVIWWSMSLDWKLHQMVFNFSVWIVGALVLSPFLKAPAAAARPAA